MNLTKYNLLIYYFIFHSVLELIRGIIHFIFTDYALTNLSKIKNNTPQHNFIFSLVGVEKVTKSLYLRFIEERFSLNNFCNCILALICKSGGISSL